MTSPRLITAGSPPTGRIVDFELVFHDGRTLLVGSPDWGLLACTWDPSGDQWTQYRLDNADDAGNHADLTSLAAAVVDGRIVIGGGGEHYGFAMWDLESGRVRSSAWDGGVSSATRTAFGTRALFVIGGSSSTNVELWNPAHTESPEDAESDDSESDPITDMLEVGDLFASSGAGSAVAAGVLDGRAVLAANSHAEGTVVWDVDNDRAVTAFEDSGEEMCDFALITVDGRLRVAAADQHGLRLGDALTGRWEEPLPFPGGEIACLHADTVRGHPLAAAGLSDGTVCIWDLAERRLLCEPFGEGADRVHELRVAEFDGRAVVIAAHNDAAVRIWELPVRA